LSPERLLLPRKPTGIRLLPGDLNAYIQRQVDDAFERGRCEALANACHLMEQAAERIDAARDEALQEVPAFATRFAEELARQLLHIELGKGLHEIEAMVRATLAESGVGRAECTVHVNPDDMQRLTGAVFRRGTKIEADPGVALGCVQVTTPQGLLVRDVDLCIKHAAERLHDHMRQNALSEPDSDTPIDFGSAPNGDPSSNA
jgi:flagellar biosynthesis/type III secretory pathway protein FliH